MDILKSSKKMKVKIKAAKGVKKLEIIKKGDWIDLYANEKVHLSNRGPSKITYIPLGVCMELPKGFEAHVLARSSTPKKFGFIVANSMGIIDNSYCGNDDEWKVPALPIRNTVIEKGDKIAQFRIVLSQKATMWQKIKWLFSSGIKLEYVETLSNKSRGGFGTTGTK